MSLKMKLTSTIIAFILLTSMLIVGVFAVKQTNFSVGGNIVFNATGVEAKVEFVSLTTGALAEGTVDTDSDNDKMKDVTIDTNMSTNDIASAFSSWQNLSLEFGADGTDVELQLEVTNMAEAGKDNYIDMLATVNNGTAQNAKVNVVNNAGGITALLAPQESAVFTVKFKVIDKDVNASLTNFAINFNLNHLTTADVRDASYYEEGFGLVFGLEDSENKITSVSGQKDMSNYTMQVSPELVIPKYVKSGNDIYTVRTISDNAFCILGPSQGSSLLFVILPDTLTSIGNYAFAYSQLPKIVIPNGVVNLGENVFYRSTSPEIIIGDGISIAYRLFYSEYNSNFSFTKVVFKEGVETLYATFEASFITALYLPKSIKKFDGNCFSSSNITTIYYAGSEAEWNAIELYHEDGINEEFYNLNVVFNTPAQ